MSNTIPDWIAAFLDAHFSPNEVVAIYLVVTLALSVGILRQSKEIPRFLAAVMAFGVAAWWPMALMVFLLIAPPVGLLVALAVPVWAADRVIDRMRRRVVE